MVFDPLDFEQPIADLEAKIEELRRVDADGGLNLSAEIERLELQSHKLTREIFQSLDAWQVTQLARHPLRPYSLDYIERIFSDFQELAGDRMYGNDEAIVVGVGRLDQRGVAIIGHQKGRDTKEKVRRNFGMPSPEGYRKAQRLMSLAERYRLPLITLIAIGVCDRLIMLEYATYSVISPEGCAAILWKSADKAAAAAEAMKLTSASLKEKGLVDEVVVEPLGGAHRNPDKAAQALADSIRQHLADIELAGVDDILKQRYRRLQSFGEFEEKL